MCCTESYCICWGKGVKNALPRSKGLSRYLHWNSTASKRVYCLCTTQTEDFIFVCCFLNGSLSSPLAYISQQNSEAMAVQLDVSYTLYAKYPKEQTGDIITFSQFEDGGLLSRTRNDTESGNEYDENSTLTPLIKG